jgi:hypothetical protein
VQHLQHLVLDFEAHDVLGAVAAGHARHLHRHRERRPPLGLAIADAIDMPHASCVHAFADDESVDLRAGVHQFHSCSPSPVAG